MLKEHLQAIFSKLNFQTHFKASPLLKGHPLFIYELLKHCNLWCLLYLSIQTQDVRSVERVNLYIQNFKELVSKGIKLFIL
jgi:hypothetical protein